MYFEHWKKCIQRREANTIPVLTVPGKYTTLAIKSISVLLQNLPKKIPSCTGLNQAIPTIISVSASTIKIIKLKKKLNFFYLI